MTQTAEHFDVLSAFEYEELVEEALPCVLTFRNLDTGSIAPCKHVALYDAVVTCAREHERTQFYCERCHKQALEGRVDCRVCRLDFNDDPYNCPVTVITSWQRKYS